MWSVPYFIKLNNTQLERLGGSITSSINIPELEERPISLGFTSEDVERFQLKTTIGENTWTAEQQAILDRAIAQGGISEAGYLNDANTQAQRYANAFGGKALNVALTQTIDDGNTAGFARFNDETGVYELPPVTITATRTAADMEETTLANKFDVEDAVVRNGGLVVKTYSSEAKAIAARGGLVASYISNMQNQARELSGAEWVKKYLGSSSTTALLDPFKSNVDNFISAIKVAGGNVSISATYRPEERAYLMHWSYKTAKGQVLPENVPAMDGVNIEWNHGGLEASKSAARDMVNAYGMQNLRTSPALNSRHTNKNAIDMNISWQGTLSILNGQGDMVKIDTLPRSGMNSKLIEVGSSYGVIKYHGGDRDKPHWSDNGR